MSLTPARDELEARKKREEIELCGKNKGPHDYVAIEWVQTETVKRATRLLCRVCFKNVATKVLLENYPEITV